MRNQAGNLAQRNYSSRRTFVIVMKPSKESDVSTGAGGGEGKELRKDGGRDSRGKEEART